MNFLAALLLAAVAPGTPSAPVPASGTIATAAVEGNPRIASVDLVSVPGDRLFLRTRNAAGAKVDGLELASVHDVLAVLGDRKLAAFWPAVSEFAGPDIVRHRDRMLERTAVGLRLGIAPASPGTMRQLSLTPTSALAASQRFGAMIEAGRFEAGLAEIRAGFAPAAAGRTKADIAAHFELRAAVAQALAARDRIDEALAVLEAGERSPHTDKEFRANYRFNRAELLAEAGRGAEALRLADAVFGKGEQSHAYPDAVVSLAWIRGCAFHRLGRTAESAAEYRTVEAAVSPKLAMLRLRALACLGDDGRLAAELVRQLRTGDLPSYPALLLRSAQTSRHRWAIPFARVAARPDVRAALDARSRPLPAAMQPALLLWTGD